MDVVGAIRRANLNLLLKEVGDGRGDAAALSRLTGVKAPIISQLRRPTYYAKTGAERTMGDEIARKLEKGMGKPVGWMDHPHDSTRDDGEAEFLNAYRRLTVEQREHLGRLAAMLADGNRPAVPEDPDPPHPRKPAH